MFCHFSRCSPLAPSWYRVHSYLYHISFCRFSGCSPLTPGWYSIGSHLYHILFYYFSGCDPLAPVLYSVGSHSGCGPLAPSCYNVGSYLYYILFYHFTGSYLLLTIWQLKTYLFVCFYFVRWITRFSRPEYVPLHAHSPRVLSPQEPELSVYVVLASHKHKVLNS
jgi:hypothetical protein